MDIRKVVMDTVELRWMCSNDGCEGEMVKTGRAQLVSPARHEHMCSECVRREYATTSYPTVTTEPRKEEEYRR